MTAPKDYLDGWNDACDYICKVLVLNLNHNQIDFIRSISYPKEVVNESNSTHNGDEPLREELFKKRIREDS
jgi:hypothetical protein